MNEAAHVVFDDIVEDRQPATATHMVTMYTSLEHNDFLASASLLVFQLTADVLVTRNDVPLSVTIEHSADGVNWKSKNPAPEISATVPATARAITFYGGERWPAVPGQRFVRLCLNAGGSVGEFAMNVVIHALGRSRITRARPAPTQSSLPGDATLFGMRREAVSDIESVLHAAGEMPHEDRAQFLMRRLSAETHREISAFQARLLALEPASKRSLLHVAMATIGILTAPLPPPKNRNQSAEATLCDECLPVAPAAGEPKTCDGGCNPSPEHPASEGM